jgi:hypothetical protein
MTVEGSYAKNPIGGLSNRGQVERLGKAVQITMDILFFTWKKNLLFRH